MKNDDIKNRVVELRNKVFSLWASEGKWESDNPMVAMLAEDGEVVTISKGVAHIKATTAIFTTDYSHRASKINSSGACIALRPSRMAAAG